MKNKLIAKIIFICFFLFVVLYGAWCAGVVLREPDICFLLAGGRDIVEHGRIPAADPFVFTLQPPVFVQQWLSEVIFYGSYKLTTGAGLLALDAAIVAATFLVIPYRICRLNGMGAWKALAMGVVTALATLSHISVRPEIFSFLMLGCFLELLNRIERGAEPRIKWRFVAAFTVLMVAWVNLHSLFIIGPLLIGFYIACRLVERFVLKVETPLRPTIFVVFGFCLMAIFVNPYGVGLINYIGTFFVQYGSGTLRSTVNEMAPISSKNWTTWSFFPFYFISALGLISLFRKGLPKPKRAGDLFAALIIPGGIAAGVKTIRTIPMSDLLVMSGAANMFSLKRSHQAQAPEPQSVDEHLDVICSAPALFAGTCIVLAALGAFLMANIIETKIPENSAAFTVPDGAIAFLTKSTPGGKVLNDPHFGNIMEWQLPSCPKLFFDSRYYLFGQDFVDQYWAIVKCRDDWKKRFDGYGIDWIFLPPDLELSQTLAKDPDWKVLYADKTSTIIARVKPVGSADH